MADTEGGKLELRTDARAEYASYDAMRASIQRLKPMRPVDASTLITGMRCRKEYYDTLEQRSKKALKLAQRTAQATIDDLRSAQEAACESTTFWETRSEALTTEVGLTNVQISLLKSQLAQAEADFSQAQTELAQTQTELAQTQTDLAQSQTDLAQSQTDLAQSQAQAAAAAAAIPTLPSRVPAVRKLDDLMYAVTKFLRDKHTTLLAQSASAPNSTASPAKEETWIQQRNTNPQFSTVREITYRPPTKGSTEGKWFFDSSDKKGDPKALDDFVEITDPAIGAQLRQLGHMTPSRKLFKPAVGTQVTYSYNNHTYEASVVYSVKPWIAAQQQAAPKSESVEFQMMLQGPFFAPSKKELDQYGANVDTDEAMHEIVGHVKLAELATLWSSFSYGFSYDELLSTLWVKPKWFASWLETAKSGDYEIRVVGHGVRSSPIDALAKDPRGFNFAKSNAGRATGDGGQGFGIYVSPLDAIPADYNTHGKYGTMLLGLLLVEKPTNAGLQAQTTTTTSAASYQVSTAAYEFYSLDVHHSGFRPGYLGLGATVNDAICVRDQTLLLWLGKVVAK